MEGRGSGKTIRYREQEHRVGWCTPLPRFIP
jgi:hypothetical protein